MGAALKDMRDFHLNLGRRELLVGKLISKARSQEAKRMETSVAGVQQVRGNVVLSQARSQIILGVGSQHVIWKNPFSPALMFPSTVRLASGHPVAHSQEAGARGGKV